MITAIVLIKTKPDAIISAAETIAALPAARKVYSVAGEWDLIAIVLVAKHEELADVISGQISAVEGITRTATHIAFRVYSNEDLDVAWDVGLD